MKIKEIYKIIMKKFKIIEIHMENHENHENFRNPYENLKTH